MPVEDWHKLAVTLKAGKRIEVNAAKRYCKSISERIQEEEPDAGSRFLMVCGWIATPLIVKKQFAVDPKEVAAIEVTDNPQFLYAMVEGETE